VKLYLLPLGQCDVDKGAVLTPGSGDGERIRIPIVAYLIETDDRQRILIDTGMHRKHIADPQATFGGKPFAAYLTPIMAPADDIASRLYELGLTAGDIDILVSTHFHFDHAGNHADFDASRIVVQREAHEYALANPVRFPGDIWNLPHLRYEHIDGNYELAPGVTLLESSGHVPGHMSVLVRLPNSGPILLAIDAIYTRETLERDIWQGYHDPDRAYRSGHRLAEIAEREGAMLVFGHDPAQWDTLRRSTEYYD
jgi:N-acyl homoserine lactone hydrolase